MNPLAYLAMFGWIPTIFYLINRLKPEKAVIFAFIVAWLFLPEAGFPLIGLPDYNKTSATCYGIFIATLVSNSQVLKKYRFNWIDLPILIFCLHPAISSLDNDLGLYDGISSSLRQTVSWGFPYFLGRIYLGNLSSLKQLSIAIFIGGLIYAPLCLFEARMSPNLHNWIYGFSQRRNLVQAIRLGGWRPQIFMQHGLAVGMWMMGATFLGICLWKSGALRYLWNIDIKWLVIFVLFSFIIVKSTGAYVLLALGCTIMFFGWYLRTKLLIPFLVSAMLFYLFLGVSGSITPGNIEQTVAIANSVVGEERAESLKFRLDNEQILSEKARERVVWGWGGWGRNNIYDEVTGKKVTITDSLWIITFGTGGIVGLFSQFTALLLPSLIFCLRCYPVQWWSHPQLAPVIGLAVLVILYALDCLVNAMYNPVYILGCGGLAAMVAKWNQQH